MLQSLRHSVLHSGLTDAHQSAHGPGRALWHSFDDAHQALLRETDGIVRRHNPLLREAKEICCLQRLLQGTVGIALLRGSYRKLRVEARQIARQDLIGLLQRPCLSQA